MPSSYFPGPALPAADPIMPFPGEELGSTVCMGAGFLKNCLLALLTVTCYIPQTKTGPGKTMKQERMVGSAEICTSCGSNGRQTWENFPSYYFN